MNNRGRRPHEETSLNRAEPIGLECEGAYRHALERATVKFLALLRCEKRETREVKEA